MVAKGKWSGGEELEERIGRVGEREAKRSWSGGESDGETRPWEDGGIHSIIICQGSFYPYSEGKFEKLTRKCDILVVLKSF